MKRPAPRMRVHGAGLARNGLRPQSTFPPTSFHQMKLVGQPSMDSERFFPCNAGVGVRHSCVRRPLARLSRPVSSSWRGGCCPDPPCGREVNPRAQRESLGAHMHRGVHRSRWGPMWRHESDHSPSCVTWPRLRHVFCMPCHHA